MFEVMEREGLKPPELHVESGVFFTVTLYNTPVYPLETLRWVKQFEQYGLNPNQKRLLAYAHAHGGRFTSRSYQKLVGIDLYTASRDIRDLIAKGIVQLTKKGGRVYRVNPRPGVVARSIPDELRECISHLPEEGYLTNSTLRRILGINRVKATRLLRDWVVSGFLRRSGKGRWVRYYLMPAYESVSSAYESPSRETDHDQRDS